MKLDFDIVRNCLLEIEEKTTLDEYLFFKKPLTDPDKFYTLLKLSEANFIEAKTITAWSGAIAIRVYSLTWNGHEFLDNVRSPKAVKHMKSVLSEFGSASIQVMSQIAFTFFKNQIGF